MPAGRSGPADEVESDGRERHEPAVRRDRVQVGRAGPRPADARRVHDRDAAGQRVLAVDVRPGRRARCKVPGRTREERVPAVGRHEHRRRGRPPDRLRAGGGSANPRDRAGYQVLAEHVGRAIRVAGDEVRGRRREHEVAAVGAEPRAGRVRVGLPAERVGAGPDHSAGGEVLDEHVGDAVRVAGDEVRRRRREGDVPPVRADGERARGPGVGLGPAGRHARPPDDAGLPVEAEHVGDAVRVAGRKVRGGADEGDEPAVRRRDRVRPTGRSPGRRPPSRPRVAAAARRPG